MVTQKAKILILSIFILFIFFSGLGCDSIIRPDICDKKGMIRQGNECVPPPVVSLAIWGLYDESDAFIDSIKGFEQDYNSNHKDHKLSIQYRKQTYNKEIGDYEKDLTNAFASGSSPDIFMINNKWLPRYLKLKRVKDAPAGLFNPANYRQEFVDVVNDDFISDGKIYAVPLYVDTLALFYNADILRNAGIIDSFGFVKPPSDWSEFKDDVERLTIIDKEGNIKRVGATLGTGININRAADIFAALILQSGSRMTDEANTHAVFAEPQQRLGNVSAGEVALQFYTDFADPAKRIYTWNQKMDYSIDAFYQGNAAMMISYAYNIPVIRAKNEKLNFGIVKLPQIKDSEIKATMANYWGFVVSYGSDKTDIAWNFLRYFSQKENMAKYLGKTERPTPRRDMIMEQKNDPVLSPFVEQLFIAKSWHQIDDIGNEAILNNMIDSVVSKQITLKSALATAAEEINFNMWQFKPR